MSRDEPEKSSDQIILKPLFGSGAVARVVVKSALKQARAIREENILFK